jgi:hypothetical protein
MRAASPVSYAVRSLAQRPLRFRKPLKMSVPKTSAPVQIEYVANGKNANEKYIFVSRLEDSNFRLTPETTLGGCAVASLGFAPRHNRPPDSIITLILKHRADMARLSVGQCVLVEHVQLIEAEQPAI